MIRNHFLDSLSCALSSLIHAHIRVLDIGTGAGFPSIPLKILIPDIHVTAVDSVSKKILFLRHLCRLLHLQDVECIAARMEPGSFPLSSHYQEESTPMEKTFDVIVSRAVGSIEQLLDLGKRFLAPEGHILLQRGHTGKQEISEHISFFQNTGFQIGDIIEVNFSFFKYPRYLITFRQIHSDDAQT